MKKYKTLLFLEKYTIILIIFYLTHDCCEITLKFTKYVTF